MGFRPPRVAAAEDRHRTITHRSRPHRPHGLTETRAPPVTTHGLVTALVETDAIVHLGMALDLSLLVPLYAAAAVLLWRRAAWGCLLAPVALIAGLLHQVSYIVAMPFQVAAGVPGAGSYDPGEPVIVLLYLVATALLLHGARRTSTAESERAS
jgi:hypothetical protein